MWRPRIPTDEKARLAALRRYGVLDTRPEAAYDDLVRLAAAIAEVPTALISMVDAHRQWFKAKVGIEAAETPRDEAICAHAILQAEPFILEDLSADPRFAEHPAVKGPNGICFYAGFRLTTPDGFGIGTLCLIDYRPRSLTAAQMRALETLARQVMSQLELRRSYIQVQEYGQRIEAEHQKYEVLVNQLHEVVFQTDSAGRWTFLNRAWEEVLGFPPIDSLGRSVLDFVLPEDRETTRAILRPFSQGKTSLLRETIRYRTQRGDVRWMDVNARAVLDAEDRMIGAAGTLTDVTDTVLAQNYALERDRALRSFFDASPFMMGIVELRETDVVHISENAATREFLGSSLAERNRESGSAGSKTRRKHLEIWQANFEIALACGEPVVFEYAHASPTGERWLRAYINFMEHSAGGHPIFSYIAMDRTDERAREILIHDQRLQMLHSSRLSALGEMAAGIAHEINNPLAVIRGISELMSQNAEKGALDPARVIQDCARLDRTITRIVKIISGLRTFARDGERDPFAPANLKGILLETLEFCQTRFINHGVTLELDLPSDAAELDVECQAVQIAQVLLNLLNNAFDAVSDAAEKRIRVRLRKDAAGVLLQVLDSGPGVPVAIREKILEPFFTTKAPGKGTGIGLSLSRGIVANHGGEFTFTSGDGPTCFQVYLPRVQVKRSTAA